MSYLYNQMGMALPADQVRSGAHALTVTLSMDTCNTGLCTAALAVPGHASPGASREAGLIHDDDSNIHAFGEFVESPLHNLLRASPPFELGVGPIGQQRSREGLNNRLFGG